MEAQDDLTIKRDKLAQALGTGLRAYFMSQFVPGAKESDIEYECVTEGHVSIVRFKLTGVNSKLVKAVTLDLRLEHSS